MTSIAAKFKLHYAAFTLDVDLALPATGVTALFGQSGSGKTTLLRCMAGLERAEVGKLTVNGNDWQSDTLFTPTHKRPIGYVFQEASLFDHLTARGNLEYAIKRAWPSEQAIDFDTVIDLLGIKKLLDNRSNQLSGGERQRVAIARALLIQPRLLLMDEPLAALDLPRKLEILPYLEQLKDYLSLPIIYVSHAADEIARLADYVVAMENGRAVATGSLKETLSRLDFPIQMGEDVGVVLNGVVVERDPTWHLIKVAFDGGDLWLRDGGHPLDTKVRVRILARDISLTKTQHSDTSIVNTLAATVEDIVTDEHAGLALVRLKIDNGVVAETTSPSFLISRITRRSAHTLGLTKGQPIWAQIKSVAVL